MNDIARFGGRFAVPAYAAVVYLSSLVLVFVAAALSQTHAIGLAPFALIPGLLFAALTPFIWCESRWAMIGTLALSLLAAIIFIGSAGPEGWWMALPFPAVFGVLGVIAIVAGSKTASGRIPPGGGIAAEIYAAVALLGSLVAIMILPIVIANFASPVMQFYVPALGVLFAAMSVLIWRGSRWAMIGAFAVALLLALLMADHVVTPRRWIGAPIAAVFGVLTVAALLTGPKVVGGARLGDVVAQVYAAVVYLYGVVIVFLAPSMHRGRIGFLGPPHTPVYLVVVGLILGVLAAFIWRGRAWAMIAAFALSLLQWLVLASFHPSFWGDAAYWAAPAVSGILAVLCIMTATRSNAG